MEFWEAKIAKNRHRDEVTEAHLQALGWHVITIWECELRPSSQLEDRVNTLTEEICYTGEYKMTMEAEKRQNRSSARREREEFLRRQAQLEVELKSLCPVPRRIKRDSLSE